jgi:probable rRNA maturation factor
LAGIRASPTVIVAEPAWRRAIPGAVALAGRAALAASAGATAREAVGGIAGVLSGRLPAGTQTGAPGGALRETVTGTIVVLTTDRAVRRLNARDRGRDRPTNVLTYPPAAPGLPGEIVLALGQVRREAAAAARSPAHHLAHLVVHGALHLAGHDHHHAGEARRMELAEARILHRLRVPNPWKRT